MRLPTLVLSGVAALTAAVAVPAAAATAPAAFTSVIKSASTTSCVDVPGGTTDINVNVVGRACTGRAEQAFQFKPVAGQPETFLVVNQASGLCMAPSRFNVRQATTCTFPPPNTNYPMWVLRPINATAHTFELEPAGQQSSTMPRCVDAHVVSGTTDRSLTLDYCDSNVSTEVFTLPSAT